MSSGEVAWHDPALIEAILQNSKTIAVVGISERPDRPSHGVSSYLRAFYRVIPINPKLTQWEGLPCYPSLSAVPADIKVDLVNVFRRSSDCPPVVTEALTRRVPNIWLQQGIVNLDCFKLAQAQGVGVIMDACIAVEHSRSRRR